MIYNLKNKQYFKTMSIYLKIIISFLKIINWYCKIVKFALLYVLFPNMVMVRRSLTLRDVFGFIDCEILVVLEEKLHIR